MSATRHRDLRTGASPWLQHPPALPPRRRLRRDRDCDVIVVGAGISGALLADVLSAAGLHVMVFDRREPLRGSTAASTALVEYEIDMPLSLLARRIGRQDAERIWRRSRLALDALRERIAQLGLSAQKEERDGLYLQGNLLDARGLQREADARARAGLESRYLTARQVAEACGIRGRAALRSFGNMTLDPVALAAGFLRAAAARGMELLAPEEITEVRPVRGGVRAFTRGGRRVHARHLVFATGYELPRQVPAPGHRIVSTWAMATRPQPRRLWPDQCLIWEASSPYLYLRTTADGRVICGGGDEEISDAAARDARLPAKTAWLQRRLSGWFPRLDVQPDFAWCGAFGASASGLPSIGPVPRLPHCLAVLGYGGNGITFSMLAAQMVRNLLCGDGDADLDLVAFGRRR